MSLPSDLCLGTVDAIVSRLGLTEVPGDDTPEFRPLFSPMSPDAPVGALRIWQRDGLDLAYVGLAVPQIHLDSHMMYAWAASDSAVPNFTVDSVGFDGGFAFHLDMTPRVDLGAHLSYMDHCYEALTPIRAKVEEIDGLSKANISERQWALMSEWMVVSRADENGFRAIRGTVDAYRDHWATLFENGIPAEVIEGVTPDDLAERERRNRGFVFDADVDPVWAQIERLLGTEESERLRTTLATPGLGLR